MAANQGGVNGRENCSVCLEPFRGRQPKLLPCYHTFCLPCLTRLEDEKRPQSAPSSGQVLCGDGDKATVTISCPTCRQFIPVPPGGVKHFQTNSYVEDSEPAVFTHAVLCDLCNGEEEAQYQCTQCHSSFCIHCRRYHSSTCGGKATALQSTSGQATTLQSTSGQVTTLQSTSSNPFQAVQSTSSHVTSSLRSTSGGVSSAQSPFGSQGLQHQVKMVEDCLHKLREDKDRLARERESMENDIHLRYATMLRHMGDAHSGCVSSLRQVCDHLNEQLDTNMTEARQVLDTLKHQQQQVSGSQGPPVSPQAQHRAASFVQGDLQTILHNTSSSTASLLRYETKDNIPLLADCLLSFMGKVVKSSQDPDSTRVKEAAPCSEQVSSGQAAPSSPRGPDPTAWEELCQKVTALTTQVSSLQASNTLLTQQVTVLNSAQSTLSSEHSGLQRELSAVKDKSSRLTSDQAALHREVMALKDKSSIMHQDLAVQNVERDKLHNQVVTTQAQCSAVKSDIKKDVDQLKAECSALKSDVKKDVDQLKKECSALKSDVKQDVDQLKKECSALKSDVKQDVDQLKADSIVMKSDMKKEVDKLKSDLSGIQSRVADVKRDHSALQSDQKGSQTKIDSLQQKFTSAQKSFQDKSQEITALKSRFANSQIAFVAILDKNVTINRKEKTLICGHVIRSVGGGYNKQTGVFTAPVSGTYCFMVNTGPFQDDGSKLARLDIVLEGERIGYVISYGHAISTGHTAVKMNAGQQVWLRTYSENVYRYGAGWWTYFSGMLLQPDV